ncbi:MAG: hypothetical protein V2A64_07895 [Candidatus Omnitrophota bacterium]
MTDKLRYSIIKCALYDEPLYIIIGTILDRKICQASREIIDSIIELFNDGHLDASYYDGGKRQKLSRLTKQELLNYIEENASHNFTEHPDKEYYFQSTESSYKLLKKEDMPIEKWGQNHNTILKKEKKGCNN